MWREDLVLWLQAQAPEPAPGVAQLVAADSTARQGLAYSPTKLENYLL
jgi:hypothetical protein